MTTIIGLKAKTKNGEDCVVLAADNQITEYEGNRITGKSRSTKILHNGWGAIARCGGNETIKSLRYFNEFFLKKGISEKSITRAINGNRIFREVKLLNKDIEEKDDGHNETYEFILATSGRIPKLWFVKETGEILDFNEYQKTFGVKKSSIKYMVYGGGDKFVMNYMNKIKNNNPNLLQSIFYARGCLLSAERDITTSGLDLVVVTSKNSFFYGDRLRSCKNNAEEKEIRKISLELENIV